MTISLYNLHHKFERDSIIGPNILLKLLEIILITFEM